MADEHRPLKRVRQACEPCRLVLSLLCRVDHAAYDEEMMDDGGDGEIGEKSRGVQARNQYAPFASGWVSNVFTHRAMGLNCLPRILYVFDLPLSKCVWPRLMISTGRLNDYQALRTSWRS
jgi:hypothetical protein